VRVCRVYLGPDVAYRLLQLLRRTGTQPGALTTLAGTGTLMPFLFFTCHALSLAEAVTSGEPRNVRSFRPRCRFLLASTRFARPRYRFERATSASCPDGVLVAINVHGSEDQVKDASSAGAREARFRVSHVRCMRFVECMRTYRSLPRRPLDIRCRRCVTERGGDPFSTPDRTKTHVPTLTREGQRHPVDRDAFHRCVRVER
jgi:hypothetical protein